MIDEALLFVMPVVFAGVSVPCEYSRHNRPLVFATRRRWDMAVAVRRRCRLRGRRCLRGGRAALRRKNFVEPSRERTLLLAHPQLGVECTKRWSRC